MLDTLVNSAYTTFVDEVEIFRNKQNHIIHAREKGSGKDVTLKKTSYSGDGLYEASKLSHEFNILRTLDHPGLPRAIQLIPSSKELTMVLEWFDGETLKYILRKGPINPDRFFNIAIQLASTLQYIHNAGIIHKDVNPRNILVSANEKIKLIDFGISSTIHSEEEAFVVPELIEGTLIYIAPEQSGRTSYTVTPSCDIYSLGIVFYEALSSKPPFDSTDPLEIIHFHLSRKPVWLQKHNPDLPYGLCLVVQKMLEKSPDDRYQSMGGVLADLQHLEQCYKNNSSSTSFEPGQHDNKEKFRQTQKLYGRDLETETLLNCYDNLVKTPSSLVLVKGYSGVGKSALVKQIHQPILAKKGIFIAGKYDQFKQKIPYYAFIEAFSDQIKSILSESEDKISYWRQRLTMILGHNGGLINEVIPYLERIIGKMPPVAKLQAAEQEYRFRSVLLDFIYAFTSPGQPIAIFLDDLQWADLPSLNLLERILMTPGNGHILIIGTYRDNEVDEMHPLTVTIQQLESNNVRINTIDLKPLDQIDTTRIVADSFGMKTDEASALGSLIHRKTNGNPFFINRLLKSVYDDGYIYYSEKNIWEWNIEGINGLPYTDNVIDLMTREVASLPLATKEIMKLAAVLGSTFTLEHLSLIADKTQQEVFSALGPGLKSGYVISIDRNYRSLSLVQEGMGEEWQKESNRITSSFKFLHDRVQQAAYSLLSESEQESVHLLTGRKLLAASASKENLSETVFEIVGHFSLCFLRITDKDEKIKIAELFLFAGKKAKDSTSYDLTVKYLTVALKLIGAESWDSQYELIYDCYLELAEAEYLNSNHEKAEQYFDVLLQHAKTNYEKAKIYYVQSSLYLKLSNSKKSLEICLKAMQLFNIRFPEQKGAIKMAMAASLMKYLFLFSTKYKNPEALYHLPENKDKEIVLINQFLIDLATSAYQVDQNLMMLVTFKIIEQYLKYGFTDSSGWGFSGYSVVALSALGLSKRGFALWDITTRLHQRTESQLIKWKLDYTVKAFSTHWRGPLKDDIENIIENIKGCMMNGDPIFTGYSIALYVWKKSATGFPIQKFLDLTKDHLDYLNRNRNTAGLAFSATRIQVMKTYAGLTNVHGELDDNRYSSKSTFDELMATGNNTAIAYYYCARIPLLFYFGKHKEALNWSMEGQIYKPSLLGQFLVVEWNFFTGIAIMACYPKMGSDERKKMMKEFRVIMKWMKIWSTDCPANYEGMYKMLQAEEMALKESYEGPVRLWDEAIKSLSKNGFIHLEALANERVAAFNYLHGYDKIAENYLLSAFDLYMAWGATAICKRLEQQNPKLFANKTTSQGNIPNPTSASTVSVTLDLATIVKASQSLASQIKLEDLLQNLMYIVIENAGAQRGIMLLERNRQLCIVAEGKSGPEGNRIIDSIPFHGSNLVPESLIQYCRRVEEAVVLHNAQQDIQYQKDPFVVAHKVLSMMCLPITDKGVNIGLLYLENSLLEGVFTTNRLDVLKMLSGQIGISIQNALLYENLEEKVQERTLEIQKQQLIIEEEMQKSDALLLNILPKQTAYDLKTKGFSKAISYENVTVMFGDLEGFTKRVEHMGAEEIVDEIHEFFSGIDDIMIKYGIEKIKTIGDAYMCAAGLSEAPDPSGAVRMIEASRDVLAFLSEFNQRKEIEHKKPLNLRIGIHSGPVIAGVVGKSKFAYDIWGDTVNTASRLETAGQAGKINISAKTYEQVKDHFKCISRGKLEAKNKGLIDMFFVDFSES